MEKLVKGNGNVAKISYNEETQKMIVTFRGKKGNTEYEYLDVPVEKWNEMEKQAEIKGFTYGKWVSRNIVRGGYKFKKL